MTREDAYEWNRNTHDIDFTTEVEDMEESIHYLLKKCFDDFESTSCDECKHKIDGTYQEVCLSCKHYYGSYFKRKDND